MEHLFTWNYLIVIYLFLAGLSAGSGVISSIGEIVNKADERVRRIGAYLAPFPVMLGLACLVLDLHRPLNFYQVLIHYNPTSVMSWGAFFLLVYPVTALAYAGLVYWNINGTIRKVCTWLELILGVAVGIYAGLLLSAIYANPVWGNSIIAVLFFVSAISTGLCLIIIGGKVWDQTEDFLRRFIPEDLLPQRKSLNFDNHITRNLLTIDIIIIVIELLVISTLIISYALQPTGHMALGQAIITGGYYLLFWIGLVLIGLLAPLTLAIMELQDRFDHSLSPLISWAEPVMVLFGGFILRYVIVYGGELVYPILTFYQ